MGWNRCPFCVEDFLNWDVSCPYLGNRAVHVFSSEYSPDFSGGSALLWTRFGFLYCLDGGSVSFPILNGGVPCLLSLTRAVL